MEQRDDKETERVITTGIDAHIGRSLKEACAEFASAWHAAERGELVEPIDAVSFVGLDGLMEYAEAEPVPGRVFVHQPFEPQAVAAITGWLMSLMRTV